MGKVNGVHHLAICTGDIKAQIEFFTDVLGCELKALYWMHGARDTMHGFLRLNDSSSIAFVYNDRREILPPQVGVTRPKAMVTMTAAGTMHHMSLSVADEAELIAIRSRIRSRGVNVFGPVDHGFCKSIYFSGLDGISLEISSSSAPIDDASWIDPAVAGRAGISDAELERYRNPSPYSGGEPLPNPPVDPARPVLPMAPAEYERLMTLSDAEVAVLLDESEPPVRPGQQPAPTA
jgi:catechol 2,3-dioxygenase-like lactoylglutathione lyase family enzyme